MSPVNSDDLPILTPDTPTVVELDRIAAWNVYSRLQELSISCHCQCGKPLEVNVGTAGEALQLWSVVQHFTAPKHSTVNHLERCWNLRSPL